MGPGLSSNSRPGIWFAPDAAWEGTEVPAPWLVADGSLAVGRGWRTVAAEARTRVVVVKTDELGWGDAVGLLGMDGLD